MERNQCNKRGCASIRRSIRRKSSPLLGVYIKKAVKTLNGLKVPLTADERRWFDSHDQFKDFFHMPQEKHHKVMGMWMLLLRAVCTEKKKEAWFVVNGTPIRYLLREHALISGLNCQRYPHNYEQLGGLDFARRQFPKGSRMAYEDVAEKLRKMEACPDRLKMCVLYFLSSILI